MKREQRCHHINRGSISENLRYNVTKNTSLLKHKDLAFIREDPFCLYLTIQRSVFICFSYSITGLSI